MRKLQIVDEFRQEAATSLFTKTQAMAITIRLLQLELAEPENTPDEIRVLAAALQRFDFRYLDANTTKIDAILDSANVARLKSTDILSAIDTILFDVK
ncbi:MAG: hypothetical protein RR444_00440 [Oscillospiraceae bacterium]